MQAAPLARTNRQPIAEIDTIQALAAPDMAAVDRLIEQRLATDVPLIEKLARYIIEAGGKRLRPMVTVLAARACGHDDQSDDAAHHKLAAIVEFLHTATLLHDDVVDESTLRRGRQTANEVWGNQASVLVGDFLYSRGFQLMVELNSMRFMDILSDATNTIAQGEVMQLVNVHDTSVDEARYFDVIERKTGKLFEAAAHVGAVAANVAEDQETALAAYGMHLGRAFQLVDDALDYSGSGTDMGKNMGDDLAEGKPTLPLIHVLQHGNEAQQQLVRHAIANGGLDQVDAIIKAIESTGALQYTCARAADEARLAKARLNVIPASRYRDALAGLADFAVSRTH